MRKAMLAGLTVLAGAGAGTAHAEVAFGPRAWLMYDDISTARVLTRDPLTGAPINEPASGGTFVIPMTGVAGYITNPFDTDTQIVASYLFGKDSITGINTRSVITDTGLPLIETLAVRERQEVERTDLEVSLQRRIGDVGLIGGGRWEHVRTTTTADVFSVDPPFRVYEEGFDIASARIGLAGGAAIDTDRGEDARFWFYGNALAFAGLYQPVDPAAEDATVWGPDMSVGVQWRMWRNLALDARYRGVFFFSEQESAADKRNTHGINITLTARF